MNGQRDWKGILFLLVLGAILYWNSLKTPFIWDEEVLIVTDPRVHHWSRVLDIFTTPFGAWGFVRYYRPLATLSFRIDHMVWGFNPLGYHITNLLFHLANTLLVYFLFLRFFNPTLCFFGAFLFLAHPAHVEAVTYIPSRTDVTSLFFFLTSFHLYAIGRETVKKFWPYFLSALCYGCALLCKERALFLPLLLFSHALLVKRGKRPFKGAEGIFFLGLFFIGLAWIFFRQTVSVRIPLDVLLDLPRLPLRLFVLPEILFSYARIWFFPWPLYLGRLIPIDVLSIQTVILEWSSLLVFLSGALLFFRKPLERFWLVWIAVALLPVIQILPIYVNAARLSLAVSEYLIYFASVGIIGLFASRFGPFLVTKGHLLLGVVLMVFSFLVIWRNGEYRDRITFFEQTVRRAPWHAGAYNQLGLAYFHAGYMKEAEAAFQQAISLKPGHLSMYYVNLGRVASRRGDAQQATGYYEKALQLAPDNSLAFHHLGVSYLLRGKGEEAIQYFDRAIHYAPESMLCSYTEKGRTYWQLGEKEKALAAVNEGLKVDRTDPALQQMKQWMQQEFQKR